MKKITLSSIFCFLFVPLMQAQNAEGIYRPFFGTDSTSIYIEKHAPTIPVKTDIMYGITSVVDHFGVPQPVKNPTLPEYYTGASYYAQNNYLINDYPVKFDERNAKMWVDGEYNNGLLLCDMDLAVNDKFWVMYNDSVTVTSVYWDNNGLKHIVMDLTVDWISSTGEQKSPHYELVEGVGPIYFTTLFYASSSATASSSTLPTASEESSYFFPVYKTVRGVVRDGKIAYVNPLYGTWDAETNTATGDQWDQVDSTLAGITEISEDAFSLSISERVLTVTRVESTAITYILTDINGQIVKQGVLTESTTMLDLSELPAGMYIFSAGKHSSKIRLE